MPNVVAVERQDFLELSFIWNVLRFCFNSMEIQLYMMAVLKMYWKLCFSAQRLQNGQSPYRSTKSACFPVAVVCPHPLGMYICIEVTLCGIVYRIGRSNWAKRRDPSVSWLPYSNAAVPSLALHARWIILAHSTCVFWTNFILGISKLISRCCAPWFLAA